jgi:tetratricopeptide (TPR) repeat protein
MFARRYADAVAAFQTALRIVPRLGSAMNGLCAAQALAEKMSDALEPCLSAADANPGSSIAYYFLGFAYIDRGELEKGLGSFELRTALSPTPRRSRLVWVSLT